MAFKVKHFIECDSCGAITECHSVHNESNRKSAAELSGYVRYNKKEFCDLSCKQMYIDFNKKVNK